MQSKSRHDRHCQNKIRVGSVWCNRNDQFRSIWKLTFYLPPRNAEQGPAHQGGKSVASGWQVRPKLLPVHQDLPGDRGSLKQRLPCIGFGCGTSRTGENLVEPGQRLVIEFDVEGFQVLF